MHSKVCTLSYTHAQIVLIILLLKMASDSDSSGSGSTSSNRKVSDVWKYFTKLADMKKAVCTICQKEFAYLGGTTNLRDHLTSKHALFYCPETKKTESKKNTLDGFIRPAKCSDARMKNITDRVTQMIVQDLRPIRMVECDGFRNLMSYLEPGYVLPSRKQFTADINLKHARCKEVLKERLNLKNEAPFISLTTDIWTSLAMESYLTVTAHYIDNSWELQAFVLETLPFPERHTGVNIADKLKGLVERWDIMESVMMVSHDQGSNMKAAMEILHEECNWKSLHCAAHCLQLCILAGFRINSIDKLLSATKKIVTHFHHSVVALEALKRKQAQMSMSGKKLVTSCVTRWNSTYEMLDRLLKLRWPITAVLSDGEVTKVSDRYLDLKSEQWKLAEDLVTILEPFSIATTFFSYEENVSMSAVYPILNGILNQLATSQPSESVVIKQFKETVSSNIIERFELRTLHNAHPMLLTAILDPRFKNLTLSKFTDSEQEQLKQSIVDLMEMYKEFEENETDLHTSPTEPAIKRPKKLSALDKLLGEEKMISELPLSTELEKYLAEHPSPRRENPLQWWKGNAARFKVLSYVARRLLCMPATTTSSERVFSTAGITVNKLRSCLKPKNVDALIFLNKNMCKLTKLQ